MLTKHVTLSVTLTIALPDPLAVDVPATGPYSLDSIAQQETLRWIEKAEELTTAKDRQIGVKAVLCCCVPDVP